MFQAQNSDQMELELKRAQAKVQRLKDTLQSGQEQMNSMASRLSMVLKENQELRKQTAVQKSPTHQLNDEQFAAANSIARSAIRDMWSSSSAQSPAMSTSLASPVRQRPTALDFEDMSDASPQDSIPHTCGSNGIGSASCAACQWVNQAVQSVPAGPAYSPSLAVQWPRDPHLSPKGFIKKSLHDQAASQRTLVATSSTLRPPSAVARSQAMHARPWASDDGTPLPEGTPLSFDTSSVSNFSDSALHGEQAASWTSSGRSVTSPGAQKQTMVNRYLSTRAASNMPPPAFAFVPAPHSSPLSSSQAPIDLSSPSPAAVSQYATSPVGLPQSSPTRTLQTAKSGPVLLPTLGTSVLLQVDPSLPVPAASPIIQPAFFRHNRVFKQIMQPKQESPTSHRVAAERRSPVADLPSQTFPAAPSEAAVTSSKPNADEPSVQPISNPHETSVAAPPSQVDAPAVIAVPTAPTTSEVTSEAAVVDTADQNNSVKTDVLTSESILATSVARLVNDMVAPSTPARRSPSPQRSPSRLVSSPAPAILFDSNVHDRDITQLNVHVDLKSSPMLPPQIGIMQPPEPLGNVRVFSKRALSAKSHKYHLNDTTAPKGLPSPPPEAVTGSRYDGSPLPISDGGSYTRLPQHRNAPSFTSAPLSPRTLASLEIQARPVSPPARGIDALVLRAKSPARKPVISLPQSTLSQPLSSEEAAERAAMVRAAAVEAATAAHAAAVRFDQVIGHVGDSARPSSAARDLLDVITSPPRVSAVSKARPAPAPSTQPVVEFSIPSAPSVRTISSIQPPKPLDISRPELPLVNPVEYIPSELPPLVSGQEFFEAAAGEEGWKSYLISKGTKVLSGTDATNRQHCLKRMTGDSETISDYAYRWPQNSMAPTLMKQYQALNQKKWLEQKLQQQQRQQEWQAFQALKQQMGSPQGVLLATSESVSSLVSTPNRSMSRSASAQSIAPSPSSLIKSMSHASLLSSPSSQSLFSPSAGASVGVPYSPANNIGFRRSSAVPLRPVDPLAPPPESHVRTVNSVAALSSPLARQMVQQLQVVPPPSAGAVLRANHTPSHVSEFVAFVPQARPRTGLNAPLWTTPDDVRRQTALLGAALKTVSPAHRYTPPASAEPKPLPPLHPAASLRSVSPAHAFGEEFWAPAAHSPDELSVVFEPAKLAEKPPPIDLHPEVVSPDSRIDRHRPPNPDKYTVQHSRSWMP